MFYQRPLWRVLVTLVVKVPGLPLLALWWVIQLGFSVTPPTRRGTVNISKLRFLFLLSRQYWFLYGFLPFDERRDLR